MVDKEVLPHDTMMHRHDCQNYLFQLKPVSRLEMEVQIRLLYRSAFQVYCGAMDCYKDHHSAAEHYCIQGEKNIILHSHYRYFPHVVRVAFPR